MTLSQDNILIAVLPLALIVRPFELLAPCYVDISILQTLKAPFRKLINGFLIINVCDGYSGCQLDWMWDQLKDMSLCLWRYFLEGLTETGRPSSRVVSNCSSDSDIKRGLREKQGCFLLPFFTLYWRAHLPCCCHFHCPQNPASLTFQHEPKISGLLGVPEGSSNRSALLRQTTLLLDAQPFQYNLCWTAQQVCKPI